MSAVFFFCTTSTRACYGIWFGIVCTSMHSRRRRHSRHRRRRRWLSVSLGRVACSWQTGTRSIAKKNNMHAFTLNTTLAAGDTDTEGKPSAAAECTAPKTQHHHCTVGNTYFCHFGVRVFCCTVLFRIVSFLRTWLPAHFGHHRIQPSHAV